MPRVSPARLLFTLALATSASLPGAEPRWIRLRSANFEMYSSAGARGARDILKEFEQVRGFFLQVSSGPAAHAVPVRIVAFASAKEYEPYRLNEFAIAYYHQTADFDYIVMSHSGSETFPIAVHEYVHLLVRHAGMRLPPWLNEGLAELYSTLRPLSNKILVGDLIPGRYQALRNEKWVPLSVILSADQNSPYYNEKNKAGSLYNEGWALTHMLALSNDYRPRFPQLVASVSKGADSVQALQDVYGRSLPQIERDLQVYLRGTSFQGALVTAKLDKTSAEIPAETVSDVDIRLVLADLRMRPGQETELRSALESLMKDDPKRPEPYRGLAYLAWRGGRHDEAIQLFGKAYDLGDRDPKMLWDYGRLLESGHGEQAIPVLTELLAKDATRLDVRLELSETQLRAGHSVASLATLAAIHSVPATSSARFFRLAVYAHLLNHDQKNAEETARRFRQVAKTDEDRAAADLLVSQAIAGKAETITVSADEPDTGRPQLRRSGATPAPSELSREAVIQRLSIAGTFVELDCQGKQARMIVETPSGKKAFLIEDPDKIAITAGSAGPVDMACGPQAAPKKVEVGYDPPAPNQKGVDGILKTIAF